MNLSSFLLSLAAITSIFGCAPKLSEDNQSSDDRASTAAQSSNIITVATYNVELMDDDSGTSPFPDLSAQYSNWISGRLWINKARTVAKALALVNAPDVVGLQELGYGNGQGRSLNLLWPELQKLGYKYKVFGAQGKVGPERVQVSQTVAIISKYPIVSSRSIAYESNFAPRASRAPLVADIKAGNTTFRVYNSHWKAKGSPQDSRDESARMEVAQLIRHDIDETKRTNPNLDIIVLGDFNSQYHEPSQRTGLGAGGNEAKMLTTNSEPYLYNLWYNLPVEKRCTYAFNEQRDCIDNIVISPSLYDNHGLQFVRGSLRSVGESGTAHDTLFTADGTPFRWQTRLTPINEQGANIPENYTRYLGIGYSDHLPVIASFKNLGNTGNMKHLSVSSPMREVDHAPNTLFVRVPYCTAKDGRLLTSSQAINLTTQVDFANLANHNKCFTLKNGSIPLRVVDTYTSKTANGTTTNYDYGFSFATSSKDSTFVVITLANDDKNSANGRIINSNQKRNQFKQDVNAAIRAGKKVFLKELTGRLGWKYGKLHLYAENKPVIVIK